MNSAAAAGAPRVWRIPRPRRQPGTVLLQAPLAERLEPGKVLLLTLIFYVGALAMVPLVPTDPASPGAIVYWIVLALGALVGLRLARWSVRPLRKSETIDIARTAARFARLGAAGVVLLCVDRFVLRGAPLSFSILEVREAIEDAGSGPISMIAASLGAFAPTSMIVLRLARRDGAHLPWLTRAMAWTSVTVYVLLTVAQGSRSVLLATVLGYLFAIHMMDAGRRTHRNGLSPATYGFVAIGMVVVVSVWLLLKRLDEMGVDPLVSLRLSGYAEAVQPPESIYGLIEGAPEWGPILAALLSLVLYVFHGFYEFSILMRDFASAHTGGALILWLPAKVASIVSGVPLNVDLESLNGVRLGIYTGFAGPMYMDFGWFGPLAQVPLFMLLGMPGALRWKQRNELWLPAAAAACTVIVLYPVMNFLDSAAGLYPLVAGALVPALAVRASKPRRRNGMAAPGTTAPNQRANSVA